MGVARGAAVAGEMFEARDDAFLSLQGYPDAGVVGDLVGIARETASQLAYDGTFGIDVHIHTGSEIEVDAGLA